MTHWQSQIILTVSVLNQEKKINQVFRAAPASHKSSFKSVLKNTALLWLNCAHVKSILHRIGSIIVFWTWDLFHLDLKLMFSFIISLISISTYGVIGHVVAILRGKRGQGFSKQYWELDSRNWLNEAISMSNCLAWGMSATLLEVH